MNALQHETSPYLLQHADNPVEWYPWGPAALEKAKAENKPILLSVGYSACHWCHVMAHESFEDTATAAVMNALFVNIKVDREERPDIDKIYQTAQYVLTQRQGGWPLTMFLTPDDHIPFLGGTYFPPESRHGLPAFKDLLGRVAETFREREQDIRQQNVQVIEALNEIQTVPVSAIDELTDAPFASAREQAERAFDHRLGGFGRAPKFPHPSGLERLLRDDARGGEKGGEAARHMALFTLKRMAHGGIYDHLGGGFFRYSVDNHWMIPHFEKMLYDNGPLTGLYAYAWQLTADPIFEQAVHGTIAWLRREMISPQGGFCSSLDADSEGHEGKFYAWDRDEVAAELGPDYEAFARRYSLVRDANFEGKWHLHIVAEFHEIENVIGGEAQALQVSVEKARQRLFEHREARVRPERDDKILTSWNALMIKGLAIAGTVFKRDDYLDDAERAVDFIRKNLFREGKLLATYKDSKAHLNAYLDDYAFLIDGLLHLLAARWRTEDLEFAMALADHLLANFQDEESGGFFFTAHDHESLIQRTKPFTDDALPAGNGIAAWSIARLGHLLGETRYLEAAENTLRAAWKAVEHAPGAHNALLLALEEYLTPPTLVILRGRVDLLEDWKTSLNGSYSPTRLCIAIPSHLENLPGILHNHVATAPICAYVCYGHQCLPPITDLTELSRTLGELGQPQHEG